MARYRDIEDYVGPNAPASYWLNCDDVLQILNKDESTLKCEGNLNNTRLIRYKNQNTGKVANFFVHNTTRRGVVYKQWFDPSSCNLSDFTSNQCSTGNWEDVLEIGGLDAPKHRKLQCWEIKQLLD